MERKIHNRVIERLLSWMENSRAVIAMRRGMLLAIPFLMIGSFCILFTSFPVPGYQEWLRSAADGAVYRFIMWLYNATMGNLSLFVILSVSYSYGCQVTGGDREELGFYILTAISSYVVFAAEEIENLTLEIFGPSWLFTAIAVTLSSCYLFWLFNKRIGRRVWKNTVTSVDRDFKSTMTAIFPVLGVTMIFAVMKLIFVLIFGSSVQNVGTFIMEWVFTKTGTGLPGAILFIVLIHVLWFFGIHGSNMLNTVSTVMFEAGMVDNISRAAQGLPGVHIFTKTFFDVFVLMGGSGTALCLLAALIIEKKNRQKKNLFAISVVPALFNINELVLFGFPVVFNPIMVLPFVIVPLVLMLFSAFCMYTGLVPVPTVQISWTTPVFLSGYLCTGSLSAVLLQLVNLCIGTAIYMPFMKLSGHYYEILLQKNINDIKREMVACEDSGVRIQLLEGSKSKRDTVKMLIMDLRRAIVQDDIHLFYQPQVKSDGSVYGVEALLRWEHPVTGYLYPPLIIELARQDGLLDELGIIIIDKAARQLEQLSRHVKKPIHMAVNISPVQFQNDAFCDQVEYILEKYDFGDCSLCFEVTEQIALSGSRVVSERIERLKNDGIYFHMDDFGMGHSSMKYLQSNEFEVIKLDGTLVREMLGNERSANIIGGIQQMAEPLGYEIIAEYVETEEQKEALKDLGCVIYQGALYSMPVPEDKLEEFLKKRGDYKN